MLSEGVLEDTHEKGLEEALANLEKNYAGGSRVPCSIKARK